MSYGEKKLQNDSVFNCDKFFLFKPSMLNSEALDGSFFHADHERHTGRYETHHRTPEPEFSGFKKNSNKLVSNAYDFFIY